MLKTSFFLFILPIFACIMLLRMTEPVETAPVSVQPTQQATTPKVIKEELPSAQICASNRGTLQTDNNGNSASSNNEFSELSKKLKDKNCEIIEVNWTWASTYEPMPMKISYNKRTGVIKMTYTRTNVIESYTNVDPVCLGKFISSGKRSLYYVEDYCTATSYDFNNREMKQLAVGEKPAQSELDGSVKIVKDYIEANAKDADSIDFLEWSKVSAMGDSWVVRCKYKGTNSFGAVVTENVWFYIQNNKVIKTK